MARKRSKAAQAKRVARAKKYHAAQLKPIADAMLEQFKNGAIAGKIADTMIAAADGDKTLPSARWSWNNQLIMNWFGGTLDARGPKQWEAIGRTVNDDAAPFYILGPVMRAWRETNDETGEETLVRIPVGFKSIAVYRVEDTSGEPVVSGVPADYQPATLPPLMNVAADFGVAVSYGPDLGQTFRGVFNWTRDSAQRIELLTHDARTWFHELAHAGHYKLLGREAYAKTSREMREVVAELSSAVLQRVYLDVDATGNADEYIRSWSGDPLRAMTRAINEVVATVTLITATDAVTSAQGAQDAA